jgi:MFS transporter, Spinster family, sphingosine-1-phosphate transporter
MSNQSPTRTTSRQAVALLAFMWVAYFLNYSDRQAITAMYPSLRADLEMSDQQVGLITAIFLWVYGCVCPLAGQLADKYSKRMLVVLSLALWSLVTIATGWATTGIILLALRAAMGISEALYMPAAVSLTANAFSPERRSRAVATLTTAQLAGIVGGSWFGGWMAGQGYWREAFYALGVIGLLYAVPYFHFLVHFQEPHVETKPSNTWLAVTELFRVPTYLLLCVVFAAYLFGQWLLYSWLPNFLNEKFSLSLADAAFNATAYLQSAAFVGLLSGGFLADRLFRITRAARLWLMTTTMVMCAPCLYAIGYAQTLSQTCIAAAAFGLFSGFLMGNIFPAAFEVVPADTRASAVGVLNFFGALVSGIASWAGGFWKASLGIEWLLGLAAVIYLIAAVILLLTIIWIFPRDYRRVH